MYFFSQRRLFAVSSCFLFKSSSFLLFQVTLFKENVEWRKVLGTGLTRRQTALFCFVSTACLLVKSHRSVVGCASALGHIHVM